MAIREMAKNASCVIMFVLFCAIPGAWAEDSNTVLTEGYSIEAFGHFFNKIIHEKVYYGKKKSRIEIENSSIMIVRKDKNVIWTIIPKHKIYMEESFDKNQSSLGIDDSKYKLTGTETINGQLMDKYTADLSPAVGNKSQCKGILLVSKSSRTPIRGDLVCGTQTQTITEYKNAVIGDPPADLFEIPEGYKKVSIAEFSAIHN